MYGYINYLIILLTVKRFEALYPLLVVSLFHALSDKLECEAAVTQYRYIGFYVLAELRLVNVKVYDLGLTGICIKGACYAVIKTHAYGNEHIALIGLDVRGQIAVHAEHAHVERVVTGQG